MRINIVTLGCSKNTVDSEVLMYQLQRNGWEVEFNSSSTCAKVVVINTCGFIGDAKEESINTILGFVDAKLKGLIYRIYVIGCLSQRYRRELEAEIPEVDAFFGVSEMHELLTELKCSLFEGCTARRMLTTPKHYAYLKISEGCNWKCSYCAIPLIRGQHVSRTMESLVEETEFLVSQGVKEIIVIAQDTTYYGIDLYGRRRLAELLDMIAQIKGVEWVRLHYAYPTFFPEDVIEVMANNPKICKYIDIPLQHVSTSVLNAMHRRIDKDSTIKLVDTLRQRIPGIAIRTTLMVGYPGETQADFEQLLSFVQTYNIDRLGVFAYSEEEGTPAAKLPDSISPSEKERRVDAIMQLQNEISLDNNMLKVGKTLRVIVDSVENGIITARTEHDSPEVDQEVLVYSSATKTSVKPGDFISVKITEAQDYDLVGEIVVG